MKLFFFKMSTKIILNFYDINCNKINEIIKDLNIKCVDIKSAFGIFYKKEIFILIACDIINKKREDISLYYNGSNITNSVNQKHYNDIVSTINGNDGDLEEYFCSSSPLPDYVEYWLYDGKKTGNFYLYLSDHVIEKIIEYGWCVDIKAVSGLPDPLLIRMLSLFKNNFNDVRINAQILQNKEILNLLTIQLNKESYTNNKHISKRWKNDFTNTINFESEHKIYVHNMENPEYNKLDKYNSIFKELCTKTGCDLKIYYSERSGEYKLYEI